MMRGVVMLSAMAVACAGSNSPARSHDAAGEGEVPFTMAGRDAAAMLVPVKINGTGPYQFIVDTGATFTCVDERLAERLELPQPVGLVGHGSTLGESGAITLHTIRTFEVGPTRVTGLTACALDLERVNRLGLAADGLLGLNFLRSFDVSIDFERKVLGLQRP